MYDSPPSSAMKDAHTPKFDCSRREDRASRLRTETTVTVDWIAQRLHMGTRGHAAHLLSLQEHSRLQPPSSDQPTLNL